MQQFSTNVWIIIGLCVAVVIFMMTVLTRLYRIVGPNRALVVTGFRRTRIISGGGTVVWPLVEQAQDLSLELMSFDVAPQQDFYTKQGVAVIVEAVAQIKI